MDAKEARETGSQVAALVNGGRFGEAGDRLAPVLAARTPFRLLDLIGGALGQNCPSEAGRPFLEQIADGRTEGGWVVIAAALGRQMDADLPGAMALARRYILQADIWYATDILGERVPGPGLVRCFEPALACLAPWRADKNRWVRRTAGVAVHFWAKRAHGDPRLSAQARALLEFLDPLFSEKDPDAVKGVGWGLKTLGRYYPALTAEWLADGMAQRPHRALMLRKALTYLPADLRARVLESKA